MKGRFGTILKIAPEFAALGGFACEVSKRGHAPENTEKDWLTFFWAFEHPHFIQKRAMAPKQHRRPSTPNLYFRPLVGGSLVVGNRDWGPTNNWQPGFGTNRQLAPGLGDRHSRTRRFVVPTQND